VNIFSVFEPLDDLPDAATRLLIATKDDELKIIKVLLDFLIFDYFCRNNH
jgi:hypothetical protein